MKLGLLWQKLGNSGHYYPQLAKITGGVTASILFYQLFHWQCQLCNSNEWVIKSIDEIESETGLSAIEQKLARCELIKRSLLKERVVNGDSDRLEFWVNIDALEQRLNSIWEDGANDFVFDDQDKDNYQESNSSQFIVKKNIPNLSSKIPKSVENIDNSPTPNRIVKTDKFFPARRQPVAVKVTPNYQFSGPWESIEQFEEFQRALLEYFKKQGVDNPTGWMFRIVDGITKGLVSPFWDEFVAGIPLGASQKVKRDWEIEPGVTYPAFEEERIQYYLQKGEPLEVAVARTRSDLRNPVLGNDLWEGFLRKCDRMADEAIKAKQLGVTTPYLPPSFTQKPLVTKQNVIAKMTALAPQFSPHSSSSLLPNDQSVESGNGEDENDHCNTPNLSALQEAYKTPMGRTLVKQQIAEHPEWGYGIVDGQVVDLFPF